MNKYTVIVLNTEFLKHVYYHADEAHEEFVITNPDVSVEEFRSAMLSMLKSFWSDNGDEHPGFNESIPDCIKQPICTVKIMTARAVRILKDGSRMPQFNYNGVLADAPLIPAILTLSTWSKGIYYNPDKGELTPMQESISKIKFKPGHN